MHDASMTWSLQRACTLSTHWDSRPKKQAEARRDKKEHMPCKEDTQYPAGAECQQVGMHRHCQAIPFPAEDTDNVGTHPGLQSKQAAQQLPL